MLEIHGRNGCPFAFRARLAAHEKGLPFDWIPCDVPSPDPRAATHNPDRRSPKLVDGDFHLVESDVICAYLDEAHAGPSLQPADPRGRARMRVTIAALAAVSPQGPPGAPLNEAARARIDGGFARIEEELADGRPFLGGAAPSLADVLAWPMLWVLEGRGEQIPERFPRAAAWWARAKERPSFRATRP